MATGEDFYREQVSKCWDLDFNWDLLPENISKGCKAVGQFRSLPPLAILCGVQGLLSCALDPAKVHIPGSMWARESGLVWIGIGMPVATGKSRVYKWLEDLLERVQGRLAEHNISFSDHAFKQLDEQVTLTYPEKARSLIIGGSKNLTSLSDKTLWVLPDPVHQPFHFLEKSKHKEAWNDEKEFTALLEDILFMIFKAKASAQDDKKKKATIYSMEMTDRKNGVYAKAHDECEAILETDHRLRYRDRFVCETYSKAQGQYLSMSLPFHALFLSRPLPDTLPELIPEHAQRAAVSLVNLCIQHAQLLTRNKIHSENVKRAAESPILSKKQRIS